MTRQWCAWALLGACGLAPVIQAPPGIPGADSPSSTRPALSFEANVGQFDPEVRFAARGSGYALWLTDRGAKLVLKDARDAGGDLVLGLEVPRGPEASTTPVGTEPLLARASYFRGRDPSKWITGAPTFGRVTYPSVEPGVDLVYRGAEGAPRLEYDFVVASGARVDDATLRVTGADGLALDEDGALLLRTRRGVLRQLPPVVYQEDGDGTRRQVPGSYRLIDASRVAFAVGAYDTTRPLVIDPVLLYGSYLGGSSFDQAKAVAVDANGNVYVAGFTASPDFPTQDSFRLGTRTGGQLAGSLDAFVAKLDPTGKTLLYSSYVGGTLEDSATAVTVDALGDAYITGNTQSPDFPTTSTAYQAAITGAANAFVVELDPNGEKLVYSTCFGGSGFDTATSIAVDALGNAYIAGYTQSPDLPTSNAIQSTLMGAQNAFVAELAPSGTTCTVEAPCSPSLVVATYLGGSVDDAANALSLDAAGHVWIAGYAQSPDFFDASAKGSPTKNAFQKSLSGTQNAFVAELSPSLDALVAATFLGGAGMDTANAMVLDGAGDVYLAGATTSADFPEAGAFQASLAGTQNAFVTKLSPDLGSLVYSTYLGGSGSDVGAALAVAPSGEAFIAGQTGSTNFPLLGPFQGRNEGAGTPQGNAFVAILEPSGHSLAGSSYLGGNGGAGAQAIALTSGSTAWVVGAAGSGLSVPGALFPAFTAEQPTGQNAFLASISPAGGVVIDGGAEDAPAESGALDASPPSSDSGGVTVIEAPVVATGSASAGCGCRLASTGGSRRGNTPRAAAFAAILLGALVRRRRRER